MDISVNQSTVNAAGIRSALKQDATDTAARKNAAADVVATPRREQDAADVTSRVAAENVASSATTITDADMAKSIVATLTASISASGKDAFNAQARLNPESVSALLR